MKLTNGIGSIKACWSKLFASHMILSTRMTPAWLHNLHVVSYNGHQFINVVFMFDDAVY